MAHWSGVELAQSYSPPPGAACASMAATMPWRSSRVLSSARPPTGMIGMSGSPTLARTRFPVGHLTKADVRARAVGLGLATASKPDSQDVCFITATGGRTSFLGPRLETHPGAVVDGSGREVGRVGAVELVTIGQRHGLGLPGGTEPRYVIGVDVPRATVTVGGRDDLLTEGIELERLD